MNKKAEIYDISAELAKEFGAVGSAKRTEAIEQAWEEYLKQQWYVWNPDIPLTYIKLLNLIS